MDAITFTGSTTTGRQVLEAAAARLARVQLEMGGKNPFVVLDDADLSISAEAAVQGSFHSADQRCTASSRLIVTKSILPRFVDALIERMRTLVVDDARKLGTHIGPVVDHAQLELNLDYVRIGLEEGAHLVRGGERVKQEHDDFYLEPALFVDVESAMRVAREEIFGPVTCVIAADDYEHALALANDTQFGLLAGICTRSLKHATHFGRNSEAGTVMVNTATAGSTTTCRRWASSYGPREQGRYAAEFFTAIKTSYTAA